MHHATALHFLLLVRPYMCRMLLRAAVRDALRSFDSADLDEEDPDEGVGVDERAALLQPDDFFLDDEEWYASARWLMERPQTEDFITDALMAHMTPLYVPYADVRARVPKDIVPLDVRAAATAMSAAGSVIFRPPATLRYTSVPPSATQVVR